MSHFASSVCPKAGLARSYFSSLSGGAFFLRKSSCHDSFHSIDMLLLDVVPPAEIIYLLRQSYRKLHHKIDLAAALVLGHLVLDCSDSIEFVVNLMKQLTH